MMSILKDIENWLNPQKPLIKPPSCKNCYYFKDKFCLKRNLPIGFDRAPICPFYTLEKPSVSMPTAPTETDVDAIKEALARQMYLYTLSLSALHILRIGKKIRVSGEVSNGGITLYTVPNGKEFYVFNYDLNSRRVSEGLCNGYLDFHQPDPSTTHIVAQLKYPNGVDAMHTQGSFIYPLFEGWKIIVFTYGDNSHTNLALLGSEIDAF